MEELGRLLTAMVTPLNPNGSIYYKQAGALAKALIASGSDGVVVLGTTGESPTIMDWCERQCLIEAVVAAVDGKGSIVVGAGDNCTKDSIVLAERTAAITGVDGLLLPVPYYNKPTQEGIFGHFAAIAEAVGEVPCIPYNIPGRTGVNMTAETIVKLARTHLNIVGVKEASGDMKQIARIIQESPDEFKVWSGNDEDTFGIVAMDGFGVISVASHLVGKQIKDMILAIVESDWHVAADIHRELLPLIDVLFCVTNPIPIKVALNESGVYVGGFRLPLCEPSGAINVRIMDEVRKHTIDLPLDMFH